MRLRCAICQREFECDPRPKRRLANAVKGFCPACFFLYRQQRQPAGPEKMILRILHEHLLRCGAAEERFFRSWNDQPNLLGRGKLPKYWTESIFGDFEKRSYWVDYICCGGSREASVEFGERLRRAFAPRNGEVPRFTMDPGNLAIAVDEFREVPRPEFNSAVRQYSCHISLHGISAAAETKGDAKA